MLQLGSKIKCDEKCGVEAIRIFHLGLKKRKLGVNVSFNNLVKGSVINCIPNKKYFTGDKLLLLIIQVKKKISRKNGCYINFGSNRGIILNDFKKRKPVSSMSHLTVPWEIKKDKRNKLIYKIVTKAI